MAAKYLGLPFDIHTSGQDLVFPHNENENAICESLSGEPMARYWMHVGLMLRRGKKMSRSSGTALTLRDLLGRGYSGSQGRYFLLQTHYRRPADFSFERLPAASRELSTFTAPHTKIPRQRGAAGARLLLAGRPAPLRPRSGRGNDAGCPHQPLDRGTQRGARLGELR